MRSATTEITPVDSVKLFFGKLYEELYGTPERARNSVGVAFLVLVLLRIGGYIGESEPTFTGAC